MPVDVWADGAGDGRIHVIVNGGGEFANKRNVATHNEAEYWALIDALKFVGGYDRHNIHMDSQLVIKQMQGEYAIKAENLKRLNKIAWNVINKRGLDVAFFWVRRDLNKAGKYLERMK